MTDLDLPETPFAVVDRERVRRNAQRPTDRLAGLGVPLRLHVGTEKAPEAAALVFEGGTGPIAVSTLAEANQEHGILSRREGSTAALPDLPVGTRLRILPHHVCATAAQHREYQLVDGDTTVRGTWSRVTSW